MIEVKGAFKWLKVSGKNVEQSPIFPMHVGVHDS